MSLQYAYWLHSATSRIWAVESDGERVTAVCGPIAVEDAEPALLDHLSYTADEVPWFDRHLIEFTPVFGPDFFAVTSGNAERAKLLVKWSQEVCEAAAITCLETEVARRLVRDSRKLVRMSASTNIACA